MPSGVVVTCARQTSAAKERYVTITVYTSRKSQRKSQENWLFVTWNPRKYLSEIHKYIFLPVLLQSTCHKPVQVRWGAPPSLHTFNEAKKNDALLCCATAPSCSLSSKVAALSSLSQLPYLSSLLTAQAGVQLLYCQRERGRESRSKCLLKCEE